MFVYIYGAMEKSRLRTNLNDKNLEIAAKNANIFCAMSLSLRARTL